jgi:glycosyltransferase involved in cell wall biosynthesis
MPHRTGEDCRLTEQSLPKSLRLISVDDEGHGANWARNKGFKEVKTEYVLFTDCDINWHSGAVELLLKTLEKHPEASYSYGAYEMGGVIQCDMEFDPEILKLQNYISTMSLVRSNDFKEVGGFDEKIKRFQDWDLWMNFLEHGKVGVYCGQIIFDTPVRAGITYGEDNLVESFKIIQAKHNL